MRITNVVGAGFGDRKLCRGKRHPCLNENGSFFKVEYVKMMQEKL